MYLYISLSKYAGCRLCESAAETVRFGCRPCLSAVQTVWAGMQTVLIGCRQCRLDADRVDLLQTLDVDVMKLQTVTIC